jgi:hypothetical protein
MWLDEALYQLLTRERMGAAVSRAARERLAREAALAQAAARQAAPAPARWAAALSAFLRLLLPRSPARTSAS